MTIQLTKGTRNSYLIGAIKETFEVDSFPKKSFSLFSSIGVVAFNTSTSSVHYTLHIPVKDMSNLDGYCLINYKKRCDLSNISLLTK